MSNHVHVGRHLAIRRAFVCAVASVLALCMGGLLLMLVSFHRETQKIDARQRHLLQTVDRAALFNGCREVWQKEKSSPGIEDSIGLDPASASLPHAIISLDAHAVFVTKNSVVIECGGNGLHYGFIAGFSSGRPVNSPQSDFPSVQIYPSLLYYSEDGVATR
jgi:hypothetical protein